MGFVGNGELANGFLLPENDVAGIVTLRWPMPDTPGGSLAACGWGEDDIEVVAFEPLVS